MLAAPKSRRRGLPRSSRRHGLPRHFGAAIAPTTPGSVRADRRPSHAHGARAVMNAGRSLTVAGRHRHWGVPLRAATVAEADQEHPGTRRRRLFRRAIGDRPYWWLRFAYRLPVYRRMEQSLQLRMQLGLPFNAIPLDDEICIYSPDDLLCHRIFLDMATSAYTRKELKGFTRLAEGCAQMLDVGASAGYYSSVFAQVCRAPGKIVSVEPEARSFALLQENAGNSTPGRASNGWCLTAAWPIRIGCSGSSPHASSELQLTSPTRTQST